MECSTLKFTPVLVPVDIHVFTLKPNETIWSRGSHVKHSNQQVKALSKNQVIGDKSPHLHQGHSPAE